MQRLPSRDNIYQALVPFLPRVYMYVYARALEDEATQTRIPSLSWSLQPVYIHVG